jgi:hypothetical protein
MLEALQFLATLCAALFAGAAIYINVAEHPARMELDTRAAATQWAPSYRRATWMQAPLAVVGCLAGAGAWFLGGGGVWLIAALFIGAAVPFTLVVIVPTNRQLLAPGRDLSSAETHRLLERWGRLHAVRSVASAVATVLMLCGAFAPVHAQTVAGAAHPDSAPVAAKVLYIGNSYTYYHRMPATVSAMARTEGSPRRIDNKVVAIPAATLQAHWESGVAKRAIHERKWDYVVLQEQSLLPLEDSERVSRYARLFDKEIKLNGARTVLFLTWAREGRPDTQARLDTVFVALAKELDALVAPVGPAWQIARQGSTELHLYQDDGSHPTPVGSHLTACVLYLVMQATERRCPAPGNVELSPSGAALLEAAAAEAVVQQR